MSLYTSTVSRFKRDIIRERERERERERAREREREREKAQVGRPP